ncbi:MAG: hypothetical protein J6D28_03750 [Bacilli bacterium]|nr:hypothetical protein [Bacilli bacterium]
MGSVTFEDLEEELGQQLMILKHNLKLINDSYKLSSDVKNNINYSTLNNVKVLVDGIANINLNFDKLFFDNKIVDIDTEISDISNFLSEKLEQIGEKVSSPMLADERYELFDEYLDASIMPNGTNLEKRRKYDKLVMINSKVNALYDKVFDIKQKRIDN